MAEVLGLDPVPFGDAMVAAQARVGLLPDDFYSDTLNRVRSQGFTVKGLTELSQIDDVLTSLNDNLAQGRSFGEWKKIALADGSPLKDFPKSRLESIFRTHLQTAFNHGRWIRFQTFKKTRPYLMYDAVNDSRTRPSHAAHDGVIRNVDDPFWQGHYPPIAINCRCRAISLSEKQAQARGGLTDKIPPEAVVDEGFGNSPDLDHLAAVMARKLGDVGFASVPSFAEFEAIGKTKALKATISKFDYERAASLFQNVNLLRHVEKTSALFAPSKPGVAMSLDGSSLRIVAKTADAQLSLELLNTDLGLVAKHVEVASSIDLVKQVELIGDLGARQALIPNVSVETLGPQVGLVVPDDWPQLAARIARNAADNDLDTSAIQEALASNDARAFWVISDQPNATELLAGLRFAAVVDFTNFEQIARINSSALNQEKFDEISARNIERIVNGN
jgi:SPP1 gp7 family putative phage head morphogenesis protein